ncbi:MAG: extracellular solute-binding protein [Lachnospiraceae bacterium]|nr:extracellular solute-binding protein [Lachnospiraceae bacterium]
MKKKIISIMLATVMTAGLLAGCGEGNADQAEAQGNADQAEAQGNVTAEEQDAEAVAQDAEEENTEPSAEGVVELDLWVHETESAEGQLYKKLAEDFNNEYADKYHVTITQIARSGDAGGYDDKVNSAISNGGLPDVFTIDGVRVGEFADAGAIVPIGDYFTQEDLADFNPSIIQQGTYQDQLYTVGCFDSSVGIFYNKDMFEEAGITPATKEDPWTIEELTQAAEKLTTGDHYGITMALDAKDETVIYFFLPLIQSQNSNVIASDGLTAEGYLNGQASLNLMTWIKDMVDEGYASATPEANSFELGKAAMAVNGSWAPAGLADYDINWGIMPMAKWDENSTPASACGSWTFGMSKDCPEEEKEAAAELIKFMTSTDADAQMYAANSMPPARQSAFDQTGAFDSEPLDVFKYQLANTSKARPVSVNYAILSNQFATAMQNVLTGMDPKEALDEAVSQYNFQTDME